MSLALIIVIGWLYVTVLVAANEPTIIAGIISFLFYGALPCGLILYFTGSKVRRERQRYKEMMAEKNREKDARQNCILRESLANKRLDDDDRGNARSDQ